MHSDLDLGSFRLPHASVETVVWIASYNSEKWIDRALDSVLAQDYKNFAVVVFDDVSIDGTKNQIEKYLRAFPEKVFLISPPERSFRRRLSVFPYLIVGKLSSKFLAFLDADDFWIDNSKLSKCIELLKGKEELSAVSHLLRPVDASGLLIKSKMTLGKVFLEFMDKPNFWSRLAKECSLFFPTSSIVLKLDRYPLDKAEVISRSPIPDLLIKIGLKQRGPIATIGEELGAQRFHRSSNWTSQSVFKKAADVFSTTFLAVKAWGIRAALEVIVHLVTRTAISIMAKADAFYFKNRDRL